MKTIYVYDCEVFSNDWLFVFKNKETKEYTVIHNDNETVVNFIESVDPLLCGFNNKHYDKFILNAVLQGFSPEEVKQVNNAIIEDGLNGWDIPGLKNFNIDQYDLMDDCQQGLSLKAIEGHLGMDIRESSVDFRIARPLTETELEETIFYCKHDVDAADKLDDLRRDYLQTKITLGAEKGLAPEKALGMTNAKLTAFYLGAKKPFFDRIDEREYRYPRVLKFEYIPQIVFDFFNKLRDESIPDEEVFGGHVDLIIGGCPSTIAYGGIHGAVPCYSTESTDSRVILNYDVASYYPHQMIINGYCSRNLDSPDDYKVVLERRVAAKKSEDKATANVLKLILNTTYGCLLNRYNELYDPLMARSVCISGQLQLLELAEHLWFECVSMKIVQLNTDGLMIEVDISETDRVRSIIDEWQSRTGFTLEEDRITKIIQKDVNNYCLITEDGKVKIKGGCLVRGVSQAGAFNVNNNAVAVANALRDYLAYNKPIEDSINEDNNILNYQIIAKVSSKYGDALHEVNGELLPVQKVNRVYASSDYRYGTLYKRNLRTGTPEKVAGLPLCCRVDNDNHLSINDIDKDWYIRLAKRQTNDFLGMKKARRNTRKVNSIKKKIIEKLDGLSGNEY